jgi:hydroxyquinol 1,2-dioxygenase
VLAKAAGIHPASDVLGVSMLVDAINNRRPSGATPSTVEGPFHVPNAPPIANGGDIAKGAPGTACFITGTVRGLDGEPVAGAVLDLWQTDGEGLYEGMRDATGPWMRGSTARRLTAATPSAPSRRSATPSR